MWTTQIVDKRKKADKFYINVLFTNGDEEIRQDYCVDFLGASEEWLKRQLGVKIKQLEDVQKFSDSLELGDIEPSFEQKTSPTAAEKAKTDFMLKLFELRQLQRAAELGLIDENDSKISDLKSKLKIDFKLEYLELL